MITELRIADLGVIKDATIGLHPGLTVVTGETGAGKTMVVSGLGLLLGGRADPRSVRGGSERARVEGRFKIENPELLQRASQAGGELDDDELIVARHVTAAGRSRAYLGGAQVPAGVCAELTAELVRIYGQSEQERLTEAGRQLQLLDRFAGAAVLGPLSRYSDLWSEDRAARVQLAQLRAEAQSRAREIDLLRFGLEEIERVGPTPAEDVALAAEALRLQSADDLRDSAHSAVQALAGPEDEAGGALAILYAARKAFEWAVSRDAAAAPLGDRLADATYQLTDLTADLVHYLEGLDSQPGRLEQIAERRAQLSTLTRKYGTTCDEVLRWAAESAVRLSHLEQSDERIATLTERVEQLTAELTSLAGEIGLARREAAARFSELVLVELAALAMPHARLSFEVAGADLGPSGADRVDLVFAANPGNELRSLGRVASGGELSRVRLALEVVLAADREAVTLVFDEIDAGVGGKVAVEVGRRLARLSQHTQVVVVTHLAQVAAFADRHYVVVKADDGQVTTSGVVPVADEDRAVELARMMAGLDTTDSALAHAGELVELAASSRAIS
ncbi:MAG TPA: DNA repair protein RecN [Propionibacteriaceae bacterium]|jgi:DNA repair protein RecN (Recombination protein N)|nr:DNA repair protein RecN [Propionibacteriaceae bacterium]